LIIDLAHNFKFISMHSTPTMGEQASVKNMNLDIAQGQI